MKHHIFEKDYSADYMRWARIYDGIKDHKIAGDNDPILDKIQTSIIKDKDAALAYFFCCEFTYKHYKMQKVIIEAKEPKYALIFAQNIKNADVQSLQSIVLESIHGNSNNIKYVCKFACFVVGADKNKIESMVLSEGKAKYAHMLVKFVPGISIKKFKKIIFESGKPRYVFELAKHLKSATDLRKAQQLIIDSKSTTYIKLFAQKCKTANIKKLEDAILKTEDMDKIKKFAKSVKKSKIRNFSVLF